MRAGTSERSISGGSESESETSSIRGFMMGGECMVGLVGPRMCSTGTASSLSVGGGVRAGMSALLQCATYTYTIWVVAGRQCFRLAIVNDATVEVLAKMGQRQKKKSKH